MIVTDDSEGKMFGKILLSLIFIFGIVKPKLFIKITESWRRDASKVSERSLQATRIMSVVAIACIWYFF